MTNVSPESVSAALEATFASIQEQRMADIPVLNRALEVEAVGFMPWNEYYLGVLVTPWFMNLMLLPKNADSWQLLAGTKSSHTFPSGEYEFTAGDESDIGPYEMCSLYSPMFEFENQEAAVATARYVLEDLMADAETADTVEPVVAAAKTERTISRRELLRGAFRENGK